MLQNIRDYSDADDLWKQAIYQQALVEMKALDFDAATALLNQLPADYNDVATLLKDCVYQPAQIRAASMKLRLPGLRLFRITPKRRT